MKTIAVYLLMLLPGIGFGQLFPKVPEVRGNVARIVEKRYGKEVHLFSLLKNRYRAQAYSGWKYTYLFDPDSNLQRRTNTFQGKVRGDYIYQRDTLDNRHLVREIIKLNDENQSGNYVEYENFTDSSGRIEKVNCWSYHARANTRELFQTEQNPRYKDGRLIEFTRHQMSENGETSSREKCNISYNSENQIVRIERTDMDSDFKTIIHYFYNDKGFINHFSVDFLVELQEYGKVQIQDIYFSYDRHGNWNRMYWKSGKKNRIEAKRKIRYN